MRALLLALLVGAGQAAPLDTPEGGLEALVRMRGSADGREVYADWRTTAWAVIPGQRMRPLFRLDGFNVARMEKQPEGGWRMLSREVAYYRDLATGAVLQRWDNPITQQKNEVLQVVNDPVNLFFPAPTPGGRRVNLLQQGADMVLRQDVPLAYPNPVNPKDYPLESTGETYFASEHFTYYAKRADLETDAPSVPTHYGWTRIGPWLPWMQMGQQPGFILYVGHGSKLKSAEELDPVVRDYTEKHHPSFMQAPKQWSQPNETSWTWYRKQRPPVEVK
jgi:Protein of unknown function (DUF1838)